MERADWAIFLAACITSAVLLLLNLEATTRYFFLAIIWVIWALLWIERKGIGTAKKPLKGRGIKIILLVEPNVSKKEEDKLRAEIQTKSGLADYFNQVEVSIYKTEKKKKTSTIEIFCEPAKFYLKDTDLEKFYGGLFRTTHLRLKGALNPNHYKVKAFSYEILFQICPPESKDIIPMPKLHEIKYPTD